MTDVDVIVAGVVENFSTFGGGQPTNGNPIQAALKNQPPVFALGVDVEKVVRYVINAKALYDDTH